MSYSVTTVRDEIQAQLQAVQLSGAAAFDQVYTYPNNKPNGYPYACINPPIVESDYGDVYNNFRSHVFKIDFLIQLDQEADWAATYDKMYRVVEAALDKFDKSNLLNDKCQILEASVVDSFEPMESGMGLALVGTITLAAKFTVSST